MALFWLLAGVLSTLAALVLLLPWLRQIPRIGPLPSVSWPVLACAALTLAAAVGLYELLGRPDLVKSPQSAAAVRMPAAPAKTGTADAPASAASSMNSAIASLEERLSKGGGSDDDWELLAKSFDFVGSPADAAKARAHQLPHPPVTDGSAAAAPEAAASAVRPAVVVELSAQSVKRLAQANAARRDKRAAAAAAIYAELAAAGQLNADGWADYADAAASLHGNKLAGDPETYIARALSLDPRHPKALWLKASADEEAGRWQDAVLTWQQLAAVIDPRSDDARIVAANLQQDLARADPAAAPGATAASPDTGATGASISGEISLADNLRAHAGHDATLFIVAKSVDSPGVPVAVMRTNVGGWPVKFTLDDSQAMMPGRNLTNAGRVTIEARISSSGQAMPASGDLQGTSGIVRPAAHQPLNILIDRVLQ